MKTTKLLGVVLAAACALSATAGAQENQPPDDRRSDARPEDRPDPRPARRPLRRALPPERMSVAQVPLARQNRFAFSLSFGFGTASMSRFGQLTRDLSEVVTRQNPGLTVGDLTSSFQINTEIGFRYYFPYYVLGQIGIGAMYNKGAAPVTANGFSGEANYNNLILEFPILVGGYYPLAGRVYLYGAIGPTVFFYARSFWDTGGQLSGGLPDYKASGGVGFMGMAGADVMLTNSFALGLEMRLRSIKSGSLQNDDSSATITPAALGVSSSTEPYQLDFSGFSLGFYLRFYLY